ncbi:MAG: hypothetical protein RLZZ528_2772 [Pseudomonadota bacterium]
MTMRRWASAGLAALIAGAIAGPASAVTCRQTDFEGRGYAVCEVQAGEDLRLWLNGPDGRPLGTFERVRALLAAEGRVLAFAMNGGMYHPDRRPVGLYIEDGQEGARIVTAGSRGNFGMRPNGVFCVSDNGFSVIESRTFAADPPPCRHATQSGPMLVIDGALHPRFLADSDSLFTRNGVGVAPDGQRAFFAISDGPVNFHDFARLFRDGLGVRDALFLDGSISRLYAPRIGRDDFGFPMGPIIGVAAPADKESN